jgi:predicted nucleic acid-binding protein
VGKDGSGRICTVSKIFFDTNILVYCLDKNDPVRQEKARNIVKKATIDYSVVISTQVLQEFFVAATGKLKVDPFYVKGIINSFNHFEVITINPVMIKEAIDCSILNKLSFWDSLIITASEFSKCSEVWSEDLNASQIIRGVKVVNPFNHNQ